MMSNRLERRPDREPARRSQPHQELLTRFGVRIGEAIVTDRLAADRVFKFVYVVTPESALGATAGNSPPYALGQPR